MKKKILITGGMGYIGSHTIIELLRDGSFEPVSVDNFCRSTKETISRIEQVTGKKVKNYEVNICSKNDFFTIFNENPDICGIIHFAAYKSVPESVEKPIIYYHNNLLSIENVLIACEKFNIPNLIFSSSCSIYGEVKSIPVDENTPQGKAFCAYAHTKQIGEDMIKFFTDRNSAISAVILRYFNPVGSDMTGLIGELSPDRPNNLMPIITKTGIGQIAQMTVFGNDYETKDGSCIRDYLHVLDVADAHINALQFLLQKRNRNNYEVFNLGSGTGISVFEMISTFEKITGIKLNYIIGEKRPGDIPAIYSNSSKAINMLGWKCKYSIEDMIRSAWLWEKNLNNL